MITLAGLIAVCVGSSLQVSMPNFAETLGAGGEGDLGYGLLLFANGAGGGIGGFLLEVTGVIRPDTRAAIVAAVLFGLTTLIVTTTGSFAVALIALVIGGLADLAGTAIGQAVGPRRAPVGGCGRVVA